MSLWMALGLAILWYKQSHRCSGRVLEDMPLLQHCSGPLTQTGASPTCPHTQFSLLSLKAGRQQNATLNPTQGDSLFGPCSRRVSGSLHEKLASDHADSNLNTSAHVLELHLRRQREEGAPLGNDKVR